jgi:hypothetical protein
VAGPGNRRSTGTTGLRPCVPGRPCRPRAPRAAPHPTAPHCRLPAPRCRLPGLAGARGPHKLLTPGRGRTEANPVWTAGASARVRTPGRPDGPLTRGVRTGLQQLPPALSARAAAERSFSCQRWPLIARGSHRHPDTWILGALPSLSLPRPPAAHRARPGSNCYNLRGWLARVRGDSVRVRARYRGPGEVLAGGGVEEGV